MERKIKFILNGKEVEILTDPTRTLLEVLREDFKLKGAKEGCGKGECGACTVLLDGKPIPSCITLIGQIEGREVLTVEGIAKEGSPLFEAFKEEGAIQCGFCTPGFIVSAHALLMRKADATEEEIKEAISGNLCRCTGYVKIVKAIKRAGELYGAKKST